LNKTIRVLALSCLAWCATSVSAHAASITIASSSTSSFDIYWSLVVGGTELAAVGNFDITVTDSYVDFGVTLTNNTLASANENVHAIGLNADPEGTRLSMLDSGYYFKSLGLDQKFAGYKTIDICAWASQNCAGGAQGANLPGAGALVSSDSFAFRLFGDFTDGITLSNFVVKFQGDLGSYEFGGSTDRPTSTPEPASAILLLTGAAAALLGTERRRCR